MVQYTSGDAHGLHRVQFGLINPAGFATNQLNPQSLTPGAVSGSYVLESPQTCELPIPDRTVIDFTGRDNWLGSYQYGITSMGSFNLTTSNIDANAIALATNSSVDQVTNSLWTMFSDNILLESLPQIWIMFTYRLQVRGGAGDGAAIYGHHLVPRAWLAPKSFTGGPGFQAAAAFTWQITPTASAILPNGVLLEDTAMNLALNKGVMITLFTDNPLHLVSFVGDGTETTFNTVYRPINTVVTVNATRNFYAEAGTIEALSSIVVASGLATVASAPASGVIGSLLYEHNWIPVTP